MIKTITGGRHLSIHSSGPTFVADNGDKSGEVRYNTSSQTLEVFDGIYWVQQNTSCYIDFTRHAHNIIDWAEERMLKESQLEYLATMNPAIKIAVDNCKTAAEQLDLIIMLTTTLPPQET